MDQIKTLEQSFKNEVASIPGGERVLNCYLCGTCTAGCPISEITADYNPRKIMRRILLGRKDELLRSGEIWRCYQCHTCVSHCPQDVRFADIIRALREIAIKEKIVNSEFAETVEGLDLETRKLRLEKVNKLIEKNKVEGAI
ncbi:MAG: 4Fe-4S dicluster domain-containing protein [Clostridiales bacterium]|nr:4Fe-4S dicluster domain-containing protein [Clostridiales bacterium]